MELKVISMNKINYMEHWYDHNDDEQFTPNVLYELNCMDVFSKKYKLILTEKNDSCYSGYCNATYGVVKLKPVYSFGSITHILKQPIDILLKTKDGNYNGWADFGENDLISNDIFKASYRDDNKWYPNGYIDVNESLFQGTPRYLSLPTIYIFKGDSCAGKSFIANCIATNSGCVRVFETDSYEKLPEKIMANCIVIGNKHGYSVEDIKNRIDANVRFVICDFSIENN